MVDLLANPGLGEVEDLVDGLREVVEEDMGVVLMVDGLKRGMYEGPFMARVEEGDEGVEVEIGDDDVVDAFGLDMVVGSRKPHLADFLKHMEVFLVEDILVEQECHLDGGEPVPDGGGEGFGDEAAKHEGACLEARKPIAKAYLGDVLEEMDFMLDVEEGEDPALVLMGAHAALEDLGDVLVEH